MQHDRVIGATRLMDRKGAVDIWCVISDDHLLAVVGAGAVTELGGQQIVVHHQTSGVVYTSPAAP
ncbi:hypothetical protein AN480_27740 (plasmid) [Mycobacterium intracellulare subsp. chimaera]|nr:hypothetical protein AN480_27740 [Mycobacterium intracellulare subsp. chimaera]